MADLFAKFNCTYCQEDITGLRVKCAECTDFDLCLQCFSSGAEIGSHKSDHAYQFMQDCGTLGVFHGKGSWSAREELHLLDAIEQYGFGNWEDISRHIETRNPDESKEEYIARFIEGSTGRLTWPAAANSRPHLSDQTSPDEGPLSPTVTARLPPLDATPEEAALLGYMPQRDDFEREYDNDAESLVSQLFVNCEDEDIDVALKLAHVDMYTRRLRERARRKRVSRDFQLVSQFFAGSRKDRPTSRKKVSKEEKELQDKFRVFTQFHTAQEHEQFLQNLLTERELKIRVRELIRYRKNGLTRHEECAQYEQERLQREQWKEKRSGSSGSFHSTSSMTSKREKKGEDSFSTDGRHTQQLQSCMDSSGEGADMCGDTSTVNISSLPGYHMLSNQEKQLCSALNTKPSQFITWKTILLKDHLLNAKKKDVSPTPSSSDNVIKKHILNYLTNSGWITAS